MKRNVLYCFIAIGVFYISPADAQEDGSTDKKNRFIGLEAGITPLSCETPEYDFIRGDVISYYSGAYESLTSFMVKNHIGLKMEFRKKESKLGFLLGLRYARLNATLGKESNSSSASGYFYFLNTQTGTTTEYLRVKEVNRTVDYIEVPIEARRIFKTPFNLKLYLKVGADLGFKIRSSSDVLFYNKGMSEYEDNVLARFDTPGFFTAAMYLSCGITFPTTPAIDIEFILPYLVLNPEMSGILTSNGGVGLRAEFYLPF